MVDIDIPQDSSIGSMACKFSLSKGDKTAETCKRFCVLIDMSCICKKCSLRFACKQCVINCRACKEKQEKCDSLFSAWKKTAFAESVRKEAGYEKAR